MDQSIMAKDGIPKLEALFSGIIIDCDETENRHLQQQADLRGHELLLQLFDEEVEEEEAEEREESGEGEDEEEDDDFDEGFDEDDEDFDDEEADICEEYPESCPTCPNPSCDGPDLFDPCHDLGIRLAIRLKPEGEWYEISTEWLEERPALCRFLNQIRVVYLLALDLPGHCTS